MAQMLVDWKREDVALRYFGALMAHRKAVKQTSDLSTLDMYERIALDLNDLDAAEAAARLRFEKDQGAMSRLERPVLSIIFSSLASRAPAASPLTKPAASQICPTTGWNASLMRCGEH